ncbi:MAG TPA: hypothetical protein VN784_09330 [Candidatus Limnocylindrales bacterium]|nr:hypothetical protein [Candidatus Limnocylindrales bacterium]
MYFRRGATMERMSFSTVPSGRILFSCGNPATLWLANFQLSLPGREIHFDGAHFRRDIAAKALK